MCSEELSNDVCSEELSNNVCSEELSNDVCSEELSNDVCSDDSSNDVCSDDLSNSVCSIVTGHLRANLCSDSTSPYLMCCRLLATRPRIARWASTTLGVAGCGGEVCVCGGGVCGGEVCVCVWWHVMVCDSGDGT